MPATNLWKNEPFAKRVDMGENREDFEYYEVASVEDLEEGGSLLVQIDDQTILIYRVQDGFFAIGDICTHDNGPLHEGELDGCQVICPRHGARFDIRTGRALSLPAVVDIPTFPVRVINHTIEVGIPKD